MATVADRRTKRLGEIVAQVEAAAHELAEFKSEIEELQENLEENFSDTERYQQISDALDVLETAYNSIAYAAADMEIVDFYW